MTDDSAKEFVDRMIKSGHGAMLEHGTVYLEFNPVKLISLIEPFPRRYYYNKYSYCVEMGGIIFITTNYRVLMQGDYKTWDEAQENNFDKNWLDDLNYLCKPTEYHERRISVRFQTQIAITREANRHRVNSMAEESTRYCNYGSEKNGGEIRINLPDNVDPTKLLVNNDIFSFCEDLAHKNHYSWIDVDYWMFANLACEFSYLNLLKLGWKPQQARVVLPLNTNSELIHTAFVSDWKHFFKLRTAPTAHIDIRNLVIPLEKEFECLNLI